MPISSTIQIRGLTDRQTSWQAGRKTGRQAERLAERKIDLQKERCTNIHVQTNGHKDGQTEKDRQTDRL
jgi:hypothetical protein